LYSGTREGFDPLRIRDEFQLAAVVQVPHLVHQHCGDGAHVAQRDSQQRRPAGRVDHCLQPMTLLDVLDLVGEHAGQLLGRIGLCDQPRMDHHHAAESRVRVDLRIVFHQPAIVVARALGDARTDLSHGLDRRARFPQAAIRLQLPQPHFAELLLAFHRHLARQPGGDCIRLPPAQQQRQHGRTEQTHGRLPFGAVVADAAAAAPQRRCEGRRGGCGESLLGAGAGDYHRYGGALQTSMQLQAVVVEAADLDGQRGDGEVQRTGRLDDQLLTQEADTARGSRGLSGRVQQCLDGIHDPRSWALRPEAR
jgi:hypothetical protein